MKLKALRNILVGGQHFDEGATFETDADQAAKLLATRKVEVAPDEVKQPVQEKPARKIKTDAV